MFNACETISIGEISDDFENLRHAKNYTPRSHNLSDIRQITYQYSCLVLHSDHSDHSDQLGNIVRSFKSFWRFFSRSRSVLPFKGFHTLLHTRSIH